MHVGLFVRHLHPPLSGISSYTLNILAALNELPDRPQITIFHAGKTTAQLKKLYNVLEFPLLGRIPLLWTIGGLMLRPIIAKHRLDILHDMTGLAPLSLRFSKAKSVLTLYDLIPIDAPQYSALMDRINYHWRLPYIVHHSDKILSISHHATQRIAAHFELSTLKVTNISGGTNLQPASMKDIEIVQQKYRLPKHYILFLGAMVKRKNIYGLLDAYKIARQQGVSLPLVLAGANNYQYKEIQQYVRKNNLDQHVIMTGYIDNQDKAALYTAAECFVFPSFYEGFGLPVIEAMACGCPVIVSDVSALPEVIGDAGILVNPHDTKQIADALSLILSEESKRQLLKEKALRQANNFSWQKSAAHLNRAYHEIMA